MSSRAGFITELPFPRPACQPRRMSRSFSGECSVQRYPLTTLGVFGVTLFVSASLLFLVQPMIGKIITPLLGGTPAVWNTCMVFFQAVLLAGYAYAHATTRL